MIGEYILLALLLVSAIFIVVVVTLQKSNDEGLSGTIAGGSETYYGKDKSMQKGRLLSKWTLIVSIVFAVAVLIAYIAQPDYTQSYNNLDYWQKISEFSSIFTK
ncbi:MAG: preprotein translocase subunit SecG [Clostridia bacterium]|nr:preprotein translocase subunit SecG [Clostridia bacterium]